MPKGYGFVSKLNYCSFHLLEQHDDISISPKLLASVIITKKLKLSAVTSSIPLQEDIFIHFLTNGKVVNLTDSSNILAICKNVACKTINVWQKSYLIDIAISSLKQHMHQFYFDQDEFNCASLLQFICEQLQLLQVPKHGHRYSTDMIILAFLWQLTSSALYKKFREVLILPSITRLCQYSAGMSVDTCHLHKSYLSMQRNDLLDHYFTVVRIIDEVYIAQTVEYSNGSFVVKAKKINLLKLF